MLDCNHDNNGGDVDDNDNMASQNGAVSVTMNV